ncbi:MAG: hypothetical protein NBV61_05940 [Algoriphagus sp.]|jgi:hypothetical protein|nr:hypothetical protein [Algoriphagus sp.]
MKKDLQDSTNKSKKSNWKKYAMEFLMVFAAISLGFFADNQREKWGENTRGVQYAQRLVEDLDLDSIRMEEVKVNYAIKEQQINTLIPLMQAGLEEKPFLDSLFAYFTLPGANSLVTGISFVENLATRDELKSGNMRLIRSDSIVRHLSVYARKEQIFMGNQTRYREKRIELLELMEEVYDMPRLGMDKLQGNKPEPHLLPLDPKQLRKVANAVAHLQGMLSNMESNVETIAEERRLLRKLLIGYIEENG